MGIHCAFRRCVRASRRNSFVDNMANRFPTRPLALSRYVRALSNVGAGTFWVALGAAATQGATLGANVLIANLLGPDRFGAYAFLQATQNALALIAQLSLGLAATKYLANWKHADRERANVLLGSGTVLTGALGLLAAAVFAALMHQWSDRLELPSGEVSRVILYATPAVPLLALILLQNGVILGFHAFRAYAILAVTMALLAVALPAIGADLFGVEGAVLGLLAVALVRIFAGGKLIAGEARAHGLRASFNGSRIVLRMVMDFALPGVLTALLSSVTLWWIGLLLLHEGGTAQFGLYSVAFAVRQLVLFVPVQLAAVSLALISKDASVGESQGADVLRTSLLLTILLAGTIALICGFAAEPILTIFNAGFAEGSSFLRLMLVSAFLEALATSAYQVLPAKGLMWKSLKWVGIPRDTLMLLVAWFAVPQWGEFGVATALIAGQLAAFAGIYAASRRQRDR